MDEIKIHTIKIIQSLDEFDLKTGAKLEEDIDAFISYLEVPLNVEINDVSTKEEFIKELDKIKNEILTKGVLPLIHIEVHGSDDKKGLILKNGDFVSWQELKPIFIAINIATRFNLFIVFAMCNGAYFLETITMGERSPCVGFYAPMVSIGQRPLLTTFIKFYKNLFEHNDIFEAAMSTHNQSDKKEIEYLCLSSHLYYLELMEKFKKEALNNKMIEQDAKILFKKIKKQKNQPRTSLGNIKRQMKKNTPTYIKEMRDEFFMLDLFPENIIRFGF